MIDALQAMAEPRRLEILRHLRDGELTAGAIASRFEVTRPAISHHLAVLREAGLVEVRRQGTRRLYSIRPEAFADVADFLREFWADRLGRLKEEVEGGGRVRR